MSNQGFRQLRTRCGRGLCAGELPENVLRGLVNHPDRLLWQNLDRPVKIDHESLMVEAELPVAGQWVHVVCKRYRPRNRWKAFCALFRRSRARRAWLLGRKLLQRQIATARPLAAWEPGRFRAPGTSYLVTQWIEGTENLHLFGWRLAERPIPERLRSAALCADSLGHLIGAMHARQIAHRDLKAANLLVGQMESGKASGRTTTYLVDLDGLRIVGHMSSSRRVANLARLAAGLDAHRWITPSICRRFLRAYMAELPSAAVDWKRLWRDVALRADRIVRRKRRRGQRVL
ncbi:MAG: hypothetical protein JXB62_05615 [Pirellulales bacterium]|nr:hypothetical protein [Pirellulales bacterium]